MTVVAAYLVPGNPLPLLKPEIPSWGRLSSAMKRVGRSLAGARPDAVLMYSTQWFAVLDQLWLTRPRSEGLHVDENWYEFGDMPYDISVDAELAQACVDGSPTVGVKARGVNYDHFPIDSGTISACSLLQIGTSERPVVVGSNNLYHDAATTEKLAKMAVGRAKEADKRLAVIGVGGLSGSLFRTEIDPRNDRIHNTDDDRWNQRIMRLIEAGNVDELREQLPQFAKEARADMGMKHFYWLLGALGGQFHGARVHDYKPIYGTGAAVIEFTL